MIKPTVGRVVHFYRSGRAQQEAGGQPEPAIITWVYDDFQINVVVFGAFGGTQQFNSVQLYHAEGVRPETPFAEWMPYQKAVAEGKTQPTLHA